MSIPIMPSGEGQQELCGEVPEDSLEEDDSEIAEGAEGIWDE